MPFLDFAGRTAVLNHHLTVPIRALKIDTAKSLNNAPSLDDNLIIQGDNLEALKALLPAIQAQGGVQCIYIDPPYNTGQEKWAYNDNMRSPVMRNWLNKVVDKDDLLRHDKWLCMMMPRLKLLWELLSDDGVIFISIDENEIEHLKTLMNDIFSDSWGGGIFRHYYC